MSCFDVQYKESGSALVSKMRFNLELNAGHKVVIPLEDTAMFRQLVDEFQRGASASGRVVAYATYLSDILLEQYTYGIRNTSPQIPYASLYYEEQQRLILSFLYEALELKHWSLPFVLSQLPFSPYHTEKLLGLLYKAARNLVVATGIPQYRNARSDSEALFYIKYVCKCLVREKLEVDKTFPPKEPVYSQGPLSDYAGRGTLTAWNALIVSGWKNPPQEVIEQVTLAKFRGELIDITP